MFRCSMIQGFSADVTVAAAPPPGTRGEGADLGSETVVPQVFCRWDRPVFEAFLCCRGRIVGSFALYSESFVGT